MITPGWVAGMSTYNAEMNRRWYSAAARLTDAQRREDRGVFFRSLHGTLSHLIWTDRVWMNRFDGWERPPGALKDSPFYVQDFDEMRALRERQDSDIAAWAGRVTQEWIDADLTWLSGATGRTMTMPTAILLMHFFNHQTHHRGQAHAVLTAFGQDTGSTDLHIIAR